MGVQGSVDGFWKRVWGVFTIFVGSVARMPSSSKAPLLHRVRVSSATRGVANTLCGICSMMRLS